MKYKINLHAHTRYSDGANTLQEMVFAYKHMGYCAAVLTDHHYTGSPDLANYSMNLDEYSSACEKADKISKLLNYPVIVGCEWGFFRCEEVLCFGRSFITALLSHTDVSIGKFKELKDTFGGACIVAHPILSENKFIEMGGHKVVDGYEGYNGGGDMFNPDFRKLPPEFKDLRAYSNSDAHSINTLIDEGRRGDNYNLINEKIDDESKLLNYIRDRKPVKMVVQGEYA